MSLDKAEAVPVDTHVWQIAKRDYQFASSGRQKSITDKLHRDIGRWFVSSVTFTPSFSPSHRDLFQLQVIFSETSGVRTLVGHSRSVLQPNVHWQQFAPSFSLTIVAFSVKVLFCADLKKFQQLKETQSVEQPRNQEERVEEESDAAKSESKERSKPKKSNLCSEKTTTYVKKRRL